MQLEVKNLIYRHQLNNNFCLGPLSIESGNYLRVIGSNGSGKTTFLKCLAGVYRFSQGNILLAKKKIKQTIWVGAEAAIYWDSLTVKEYIVLTSGLYGITKKQAVKELQKYNLAFYNQNIFSLSTGQKKIVSIIASIISKSQLVILDEPDSNLDVENREFLYNLILKESSLGKQFFLFTSHINSSHFLQEKTIELSKGSIVC